MSTPESMAMKVTSLEESHNKLEVSMRVLVIVLGFMVFATLGYAQEAVFATKADVIGAKIDGKIVTDVTVSTEEELSAEVKKLEEDVADMSGFCGVQYAECQARVAAWQAKLDEIKKYDTYVEPVAEPVVEGNEGYIVGGPN